MQSGSAADHGGVQVASLGSNRRDLGESEAKNKDKYQVLESGVSQ